MCCHPETHEFPVFHNEVKETTSHRWCPKYLLHLKLSNPLPCDVDLPYIIWVDTSVLSIANLNPLNSLRVKRIFHLVDLFDSYLIRFTNSPGLRRCSFRHKSQKTVVTFRLQRTRPITLTLSDRYYVLFTLPSTLHR